MRVIAGEAKKRKLKVPKGWPGRPTADRIKESLFNIISDKILGCNFLDLYSGTGNVAIEALSRGAQKAVLVENNPAAVKTIKENLNITGFYSRSLVIGKDVILALKQLGRESYAFDLIFLDPPYEKGMELPALRLINEHKLIKAGGYVIVETSKRDNLPEQIDGDLLLLRREIYGDTSLWFYKG